MKRLEKLGNVVEMVGIAVIILGIVYVLQIMGTVDAEQYTHEYHSYWWILGNIFLGSLACVFGASCIKFSGKLAVISHKKYVRVWIRNTATKKIITKLVEDGSDIVLGKNEEICNIGKRIYHFR